jgi:O-antigen ligase
VLKKLSNLWKEKIKLEIELISKRKKNLLFKNLNINKNLLTDMLLFFSICSIFAFSNLTLISIVTQLLFIAIMVINTINSRYINITIHFYWMVAFLFWSIIGLFFAYETLVSLEEILNLIVKFVFYSSLILYVTSIKRFQKVLNFIVISGVILIVRVGLITPINVWGTERLGDAVGLGSNALGTALTFAAIACIYLAKSNGIKKYYVLAIPFISVGLMTGSKKAFFSILLGLLIIYYFSSSSLKVKMRSLIISTSLIALLLFITMNIPVFYDVLGKRIESSLSIGESGEIDKSTETRRMMIDEAIQLTSQNPMTGHGYHSFSELSSFNSYSHNNYMELLTSTGIIGLLIYYSLPIYILIKSFINRRDKRYIPILSFLVVILFMDIASVTYRQLMTQSVISVCIAYFIILEKNKKNILGGK